MAQSNWVSDDNEDNDSNSNVINFGTSLLFDSDEDRAAAMQDFAFCTTEEGEYISDDDEHSTPKCPIGMMWMTPQNPPFMLIKLGRIYSSNSRVNSSTSLR